MSFQFTFSRSLTSPSHLYILSTCWFPFIFFLQSFLSRLKPHCLNHHNLNLHTLFLSFFLSLNHYILLQPLSFMRVLDKTNVTHPSKEDPNLVVVNPHSIPYLHFLNDLHRRNHIHPPLQVFNLHNHHSRHFTLAYTTTHEDIISFTNV